MEYWELEEEKLEQERLGKRLLYNFGQDGMGIWTRQEKGTKMKNQNN